MSSSLKLPYFHYIVREGADVDQYRKNEIGAPQLWALPCLKQFTSGAKLFRQQYPPELLSRLYSAELPSRLYTAELLLRRFQLMYIFVCVN